jgi:hypothetical protein
MGKSFGSVVAGFFVGALVTGFIGLVGWNLQLTFATQSQLVIQLDDKDDLIKELVKNVTKDIDDLHKRVDALDKKKKVRSSKSNVKHFYAEQRQLRKGW